MPAPDIQWWQRYGNIAQIASAVFALVGFAAVLLQLSEIRHNNRATGARQVYLAYTDLNFKHPEYALPDLDKLKSGEPALFERYKSFVSYLLYACDEVMSAFPNQQEWRKSCAYEIRAHLPFLCETLASDPGFLDTFGGRSIDFVKAVMEANGVTPPACRLKKA
ncbi:MAG: hypothetical protein AB7V13_06400 [Pseudorhodoplanes sp.]|uniref:hypothetical protein n=1 Tax=Pseudorhodoplanes sp. TaxID=1934341 RepID=UPI003D0A3CD2